MALPILKGLVANYGKLGYQLWHRLLKMASLVYEREIGVALGLRPRATHEGNKSHNPSLQADNPYIFP